MKHWHITNMFDLIQTLKSVQKLNTFVSKTKQMEPEQKKNIKKLYYNCLLQIHAWIESSLLQFTENLYTMNFMINKAR